MVPTMQSLDGTGCFTLRLVMAGERHGATFQPLAVNDDPLAQEQSCLVELLFGDHQTPL